MYGYVVSGNRVTCVSDSDACLHFLQVYLVQAVKLLVLLQDSQI